MVLIVACGSSGETGPAEQSGDTGFPQDTILTVVDDSATAGITGVKWTPSGEADLRGRVVALNPALLSHTDTLSRDRNILLNLFDGECYPARITRTNRAFANVASVTGEIPGEEGAYFTMSVDHDQILAHIYFLNPERYFVIRYSDTLQYHVVVERDPDLEPALPGAPPVVPPDSTEN